MSKLNYLIPGLESFMEDTEVNVEVAVGDPEEVVEETVESEESSAEVAEVAEEAEATEEQAEMIMAHFAELEHRLEHVKRYGVDRTFMRLYNSRGEMERAFRVSLPGCESFDTVGDRHGAESRAVIAGLEGVLSTVWEFIKKVAAKVAGFFRRIFEAIVTRVGNLNKNIGRLRERYKDMKDGPNGTDSDSKCVDPSSNMKLVNPKAWEVEFQIAGPTINIPNVSADLPTIDEIINEAKGLVTGPNPSFIDKVSASFDAMDKNSKDFQEAWKKHRKEIEEDVKKYLTSGTIGKVSWGDIDKLLNNAADWARYLDVIKGVGKTVKTATDQVINFAKNAERRGDEGAKEKRKVANVLSRVMNLLSTAGSFYMSQGTRVARGLIQTAAKRMSYGVKA